MRRTRLLVGSSCEAVKKKYEENHKRIYMYEGKLFATQALSQTQKNVSEPQTEIEPATF